MTRLRHFAVLSLALFLCLAFVDQGLAKVTVHNVRYTQDLSTAPFDGSFADGTGAAIRFHLNHQADSVVVRISNPGFGTVRILRKTNLAPGDNFVNWNGAQDNGAPAAAAPWRAQITAYHRGFASYTEYHLSTPAIFTRGLTTVRNPALQNFGFLYAISNGGYVTGLARHANSGQQWGNVPDSAFVTTTGVPLGPANLRYGPSVDNEGYMFIVGRDARRIYRMHIDTLNVALFDTSAYGMIIQSVQVRGTGAGRVLYVAGDSAIFRIPVGTQVFNTIPPQVIARVSPNKRMVFWDAQVSADNDLYVNFWADSVLGSSGLRPRGVAKFNLTTGTLPKTIADTIWTSWFPDSDPVTLALYEGPVSGPSDDVLYMNNDFSGAGTVPTGIYAFTNLGAAQPTRILAWADPDNNCSTTRSSLSVDAAGNVAYFENSNEQVVLVSPPSSANSFAYDAFGTMTITSPGVVRQLVTIAEARFDGDGNRLPDRTGDTVRVVGIVNSVNIQTTNFGYFIQDANAGILIFRSGLVGAPTLRPGYRVMVTGRIDYFSGTTQIQPANLATDITILDTANVVTSIPLTMGQYLADPERYESRRIVLDVVQPFNFTSAQWPAAGSSANLKVWNGIDTLTLRIDSDTEIDGSPYPNFPVRLTGVATQFTTTARPDTGYQITPIFIADFVPVNAPPVRNFRLVFPPNNATIFVDTTATYTIRWRKAVDFNPSDSVLVYQWKPVPLPGQSADNAGRDTTKTLTGAYLYGLIGTADSLRVLWTVLAKDVPNPPVSSLDTFAVTLRKPAPSAGWVAQTSGTGAVLYAVKAVSQNIAWVGGVGTVRRTLDGGATWTSVGSFGDVFAIDARDANTAWVTTTPGTTTYIIRTTNGGARWDTVFSQSGGFIDGIEMVDANNGWALGDPVGGKWTVLRTTNGGATWARIATEPNQVGTEAGWNNAFEVQGSNLWFGTNASRVYRSTDNGATWTGAAAGSTNTYELAFGSPTVGIAVGTSGLRTTDGGATWVATTVPGSGNINGAAAASPNEFFVTRGTSVYRSTDRGATWASSFSGGTYQHVDFFSFGGVTRGWAVGNAGVISAFYGTVTGAEEKGKEIPTVFALEQNFPNPFNPSTTIRYSLPTEATVKLAVYNILGQEVVSLKNEVQGAGQYDVVWNGRTDAGAQVATGVYFYRLEARPTDGAEPFATLKKMVMVK